jgi:hypothetical protein
VLPDEQRYEDQCQDAEEAKTAKVTEFGKTGMGELGHVSSGMTGARSDRKRAFPMIVMKQPPARCLQSRIDSYGDVGTISCIPAQLGSSSSPADHPTPKLIMQPVCKHPKVRVVAREDDVEYVECEECGEVFDADEYQEMSQDGSGDEKNAEDDDDA